MATNVFWSPNNPQLVFPSAVADIRYQLLLGPPFLPSPLLLDLIECQMSHSGVFCPQSHGFDIV